MNWYIMIQKYIYSMSHLWCPYLQYTEHFNAFISLYLLVSWWKGDLSLRLVGRIFLNNLRLNISIEWNSINFNTFIYCPRWIWWQLANKIDGYTIARRIALFSFKIPHTHLERWPLYLIGIIHEIQLWFFCKSSFTYREQGCYRFVCNKEQEERTTHSLHPWMNCPVYIKKTTNTWTQTL